MHFEAQLLPPWLAWSAILLTLATLLTALRRAPWRLLQGVSERQHLFFGTILGLVLIWSMAVTTAHVLAFHLLLITSAVLLLGASFGVIAALLALIIRTALKGGDWMAFGVDALCTVLVPALVPALTARYIGRVTVAPIFAFTLGAGFFGGALSVVAATLATLAVLELSHHPDLVAVAWEQAAVLPLLMFSEGFINGTIMTAFAVFHPELVRSFKEPD